MLYVAYLDEFGHVGPFINRADARFNDHPAFGLGGLILPYNEVRSFATWYFQLKSHLLDFEIRRDGAHPATWEKKGSSLYTTMNVTKYRELRVATNRLLNRITRAGGHVVFAGLEKAAIPALHRPKRVYAAALREMLKRLDQYAEAAGGEMLVVLDEHQDRDEILTEASREMYGDARRRRIIEPPFQVESHRYQTIQAADWLCGLIGRYVAYQLRPVEYEDFEWAERYFGQRIRQTATRSGIRKLPLPQPAQVQAVAANPDTGQP